MGRRSLTPTSQNPSDSESSDDDEPKDIGKNTITTEKLIPDTTFVAFDDIQNPTYNRIFHLCCLFLFFFVILQN